VTKPNAKVTKSPLNGGGGDSGCCCGLTVNTDVARDCNGLIIMASKLAIFNQFMNCIIEGDAKTCIDACNGNPDECLWILSAICNDVRFLLHSVDSCAFTWVRRDANVVAHTLAQFATHSRFFFL
jgi:hypothetical protein